MCRRDRTVSTTGFSVLRQLKGKVSFRNIVMRQDGMEWKFISDMYRFTVDICLPV